MLDLESRQQSDETDYREQWRFYYAERRRRLRRIALLFAVTGITALLFGLVPDSFVSRQRLLSDAIAAVAGLLWITIVVQYFVFIWTMGSWECPRCGEAFFASTFVRNPFGSRCRHCRLRRLKESEAADHAKN